MADPRAFTAEECREMFLEHARGIAAHWAGLSATTPRERCDGVVFSILAAIDGCAMGIPAFRVVADPHPSDEAYHRDEGENWWPADCDITVSASLHELYYRAAPTEKTHG